MFQLDAFGGFRCKQRRSEGCIQDAYNGLCEADKTTLLGLSTDEKLCPNEIFAKTALVKMCDEAVQKLVGGGGGGLDLDPAGPRGTERETAVKVYVAKHRSDLLQAFVDEGFR